MASLTNVAEQYLSGVRAGSSIAQERDRLNQEREHLDIQAQMAAQEFQQRMTAQAAIQERERNEFAARLQTQKAYHDAQLTLRGQRLEQFAQANAAKTQDAARKMADQTGFAKDLADGLPVDQALFRHPALTTPTTAIAARRSASGLAADRLKLSQERLDMQNRALAARTNKPGTMDIPLPMPAGQTGFMQPQMKNVPIDSPLINQVMGTNAPAGTGTNYVGGAAVPAMAAAAGGSPFAEGARVRNKRDNKMYVVKGGVPVLADEEAPDDEGDQ